MLIEKCWPLRRLIAEAYGMEGCDESGGDQKFVWGFEKGEDEISGVLDDEGGET